MRARASKLGTGGLDEAQLAGLTSVVARRIIGATLGREASGGQGELEIAGAAVAFCCDIAPAAPGAILREASIRLAGWLYGNRPHVAEHLIKDPSGLEISLRFNNSAATADGFRSSGASALLARYIKRRGGIISGTATSTSPAAVEAVRNPPVMRFAFTH